MRCVSRDLLLVSDWSSVYHVVRTGGCDWCSVLWGRMRLETGCAVPVCHVAPWYINPSILASYRCLQESNSDQAYLYTVTLAQCSTVILLHFDIVTPSHCHTGRSICYTVTVVGLSVTLSHCLTRSSICYTVTLSHL